MNFEDVVYSKTSEKIEATNVTQISEEEILRRIEEPLNSDVATISETALTIPKV